MKKQTSANYELYVEHFADCLAEILLPHPPKDQAENAQMLAHKYAFNDADAIAKVDKIMAGTKLRMRDILEEARAYKAKELAQGYLQRARSAVTQVNELLISAGISIDTDALEEKFDYIERIDRLITIAEKPPQRQPARDPTTSGGSGRAIHHCVTIAKLSCSSSDLIRQHRSKVASSGRIRHPSAGASLSRRPIIQPAANAFGCCGQPQLVLKLDGSGRRQIFEQYGFTRGIEG